MTDTQDYVLDPEMESEAQAIANYEDERRELAELAEEVKTQDADFEENKQFLWIGKSLADEYEACVQDGKAGRIIKNFSIVNFVHGSNYESVNEDGEDDGFSIVNCLEYGSVGTPLHVCINEYSSGGWSLFITVKTPNHDVQINKHGFDDYQDAIDYLNDCADLIDKVIEVNEIHD